jgi:hypothetical protein
MPRRQPNFILILTDDQGYADPDRVYGYYFQTHLQALRRGPYKVILRRPHPVPWLKYSPNPFIAPEDDIGIPYPRLYDLRNDIGERHDVAGEHVELVDRMLALAEPLANGVGDYDRIGAEARFYDAGPRRPAGSVGGVWRDAAEAPCTRARGTLKQGTSDYDDECVCGRS